MATKWDPPVILLHMLKTSYFPRKQGNQVRDLSILPAFSGKEFPMSRLLLTDPSKHEQKKCLLHRRRQSSGLWSCDLLILNVNLTGTRVAWGMLSCQICDGFFRLHEEGRPTLMERGTISTNWDLGSRKQEASWVSSLTALCFSITDTVWLAAFYDCCMTSSQWWTSSLQVAPYQVFGHSNKKSNYSWYETNSLPALRRIKPNAGKPIGTLVCSNVCWARQKMA